MTCVDHRGVNNREDISENPAEGCSDKKWKVYFRGNFSGHVGRERAGKEILVGKQFEWADRHWLIPAVYSCGKGIVVDCCMRVEVEKVLAFIRRWNLSQENDSCENFTREQQMEMDLENPMSFQFEPYLEMNGEILQFSHGCAISYHSCLPDWVPEDFEAERVVEYYGLDPAYVWVIYRHAFSWSFKRRPEIKTLSLVMEQSTEAVPGPHFKAYSPGDSFQFLHPVNRTKYTLTVQKFEKMELPEECIQSDCLVYPKYFLSMNYTVFPETEERMDVTDTNEGDRPYKIEPSDEKFHQTERNECSLTMEESDGPSAVRIIGSTIEKAEEKYGMAHSALHFEPVQHDVEWCITFYRKRFESKTVVLI